MPQVEYWEFADGWGSVPPIGQVRLVLGELRGDQLSLSACPSDAMFVRVEHGIGNQRLIPFGFVDTAMNEKGGFGRSPWAMAAHHRQPTEGLASPGVAWDDAVELFATWVAAATASPPSVRWIPSRVWRKTGETENMDRAPGFEPDGEEPSYR